MPFVYGNHKLGTKILQWSIPAVTTCPGSSSECRKYCYGTHGHFLGPAVQNHLRLNEAISRSEHFVPWANVELKILKPTVVRVHADGDFYDPAYVEKWIEICKTNPKVSFYAYTRSWRKPLIRRKLEKLAKLKNVALWYSIDKETSFPARKPRRVKLAYMQVEHEDQPAQKVDLVFRVNKLRKTVVKKVQAQDGTLAMVCAPENGVTKVSCEQCKFCFRNVLRKKRSKPIDGRIALPLVGVA